MEILQVRDKSIPATIWSVYQRKKLEKFWIWGVNNQRNCYPKTSTVSLGAFKLCHLRRSQRASSLPPSTNIFEFLQAEKTTRESSYSLKSQVGIRMVRHWHSVDQLPLQGRNYQHSDNRRSGFWRAELNNKEQKIWHSNRKEMFAVYAAIKHQSYLLQNVHTFVQTDNFILVAYLQKEGGMESLEFLTLSLQVLQLVDRL